jgi:hypothetical protein
MNAHLLSLPLAPRLFEFNDVEFDAEKHALDESDMEYEANHIEREANLVGNKQEFLNYGREFEAARQQALNPWLDIKDAIDKEFDFDTKVPWLTKTEWFKKACGTVVHPRTITTNIHETTVEFMKEYPTDMVFFGMVVPNYSSGWVRAIDGKDGTVYKQRIVAFKPMEIAPSETKELCKRIEVWKG